MFFNAVLNFLTRWEIDKLIVYSLHGRVMAEQIFAAIIWYDESVTFVSKPTFNSTSISFVIIGRHSI